MSGSGPRAAEGAASVPVGVLRGCGLLLRPKVLAALGPGRRRVAARRWVAALVTGIGAFALIRWVGVRLLRSLLEVPEVGPPLAGKLLGLGLLLFLLILLLSNLVAALSAFFLARDLPRVLASPVDWLSVYGARLVETAVASSWMVLLLLLPLLDAYRAAHGAGPAFWGVAAVALPPYLLLPAAVGAAVTLALVRVFPARRARDLLALMGVLGAGLLLLALRVLRPERLVNPEGFRDLVDFLAVLRGPSTLWLPSEWASEALLGALRGGPDPFWLLLLWTTAGAAVVGGAALHRRLYARGYARAQEGAEAAVGGGLVWRLAERLPLGGTRRRQLLLKDARVFFRDATQWSQLLVLAVLLVVYIYNMRVLPLQANEAIGPMLVTAVAFLNLALTGFILAAVAARFVFPAFSLEGPALWLLGSAPVAPGDLVWAKFWAGAVPLLVLALALSGLTAVGLGLRPALLWLSLGTVVGLVLALVAQSLAWGIAMPRFDTENAAQIPTSLGGLLYMMGGLVTLAAVLAAELWALRGWLVTTFPGRALRDPTAGELWLAMGLGAVVCTAATLGPYAVARRGVARTLARAVGRPEVSVSPPVPTRGRGTRAASAGPPGSPRP